MTGDGGILSVFRHHDADIHGDQVHLSGRWEAERALEEGVIAACNPRRGVQQMLKCMLARVGCCVLVMYATTACVANPKRHYRLENPGLPPSFAASPISDTDAGELERMLERAAVVGPDAPSPVETWTVVAGVEVYSIVDGDTEQGRVMQVRRFRDGKRVAVTASDRAAIIGMLCVKATLD